MVGAAADVTSLVYATTRPRPYGHWAQIGSSIWTSSPWRNSRRTARIVTRLSPPRSAVTTYPVIGGTDDIPRIASDGMPVTCGANGSPSQISARRTI